MQNILKFNEEEVLQKGNEYVCVVDKTLHIFPSIEDANNYICYQYSNIEEYEYKIYNIKCISELGGK